MFKLTNNASGVVGASLASNSTSLSLATGNGAYFPALSPGEFFYGTLVDSSNNLEIVKVTARTGDTLTIVRGQDGTSARAYNAGDKFELRLVAAVFSEIIQRDGSVAMTGALNLGGFKATNVADPASAQDAATKNYVDSTAVAAVNAEAATRASADTTLQNNITAEATARANADALKVNKSGDTMTGNLTIANTANYVTMQDTDWGTRHLHHNGGTMGHLDSAGNWSAYDNNSGQMWSKNYGWLHDYFFSTVANCAPVRIDGSNCNGNAGNCMPEQPINCYGSGNLGQTRIELMDNGSQVAVRSVQYNYNCNCNCNCTCK